ncbi:MAG: chromosome segregation protein SMC [Gammaproteobacteria bacterium]|nr:chromosome segregation protein SMC [Gammaproteobacteria bacterium]NIR82488.1 chromosome segregation protein SMC [Gammaproteobacteria bacterium]NIR88484.1 chromosome segregation protein SMC [Gammaproteobacteria bacterium]NIU03624.1 chromosome segregation protein SMC [Gammaproteobacteria bacterium]NIV50976.1 chromosome segregation protein SMC [Gammaproteobacteria bacterium]
MRLRKVKLAGFKSFVDPTSITFPSDLVGVVGPNGCGKSNVIDAVRWVMGEISAKHLRGDSMADVVFNGSSARKPVGQASVELVFDNSEGVLGGRYASYGEIAVKRQVAREGQSAYFLNGARCRRRDITDIFLGTGLGPRSYAIIEQGMISRLIEAKPDELREFLEEAAGISKYKERRRETENRIRHTQENLDRLNDLREELDRRLEHLKRQARMAERYRVLKQEERLLRAQLLALRWRALDAEVRAQNQRIGEQETALDAALSHQRRVEAELETRRSEQHASQDAYNEVYRHVLDAGAEIARVEETIQNLRERRHELRESLAREEHALTEARTRLASDAAKLQQLEQSLGEEEPGLARSEEAVASARGEFEREERESHALQAQWEDFSERATEPARDAHAERARIHHLEHHMGQVRERLLRLEQEFETLTSEDSQREAEALQEELAGEERRQAELDAALGTKQEAIRETRERMSTLSSRLDGRRRRHQETLGRLASLRALQEEALGKRSEAAMEWLRGQELDALPRLAEEIQVEDGWERAVEMALGFHLEAVCVSGVRELAGRLARLDEGAVGLVEASTSPGGAVTGPPTMWLRDTVTGPDAVAPLLDGVRTAENVAAALAVAPELGPGESVITRDGVWLGAAWARAGHDGANGTGVLAREGEIRSLGDDLRRVRAEITRDEEELAGARGRLRDLEDEHSGLQSTVSEAHRQYASVKARLGAVQAELAQTRARAEAVAAELEELRAQLAVDDEQLTAARQRLEHSTGEMQRMSGERGQWEQRRREQRDRLEAARRRWQSLRDEAYEVGLRVQSLRTQIASLQEAAARNREQVSHLEARSTELQGSLSGTEAPLREARQTLDEKLEARQTHEDALKRARERVETVEAALRELEQERHKAEAVVQSQRDVLQDLRMQSRETEVRRQTHEEQLQGTGHPLSELLEGLADEAQAPEWEEKLERQERRIARLGPINLAAIDEFEQQSERKRYLDEQHTDLTQALTTLQEAIHKIDRESRARFRETYEKVNATLAATFPRLFGGGRASLQMTGDDLLSTGIAVMAQPPGKRNSTIHLLSGGEKALTAVALVFAIFELNPAPFCLLDEVDAPLDDANVGRFCELVKEMSERVQFVMVTHNKTTMEMTDQLIGVTMNEPGVSRLVAVDVDEAVEMAAV